MQIVATTPLAIAMLLGILWLGPVRGLWILFVSMPFGSASAFNAPGLGSMFLTDFCVFAMWLSLLVHRTTLGQLAGTLRIGQPGFPLLMLIVVTTIGALFLPRVMMGQTEVFVMVQREAGTFFELAPLQFSTQNISQLIRLIIAASSFLLLATVFRKSGSGEQVYKAFLISSIVHIILSFLDIGSYAIGMPDLLDPIRTALIAMLDHQRLMGVKRMMGGFPEPAAFGFYTMSLYGYWLRYWFGARGTRRSRIAGFMALMILFLLIRSTSTATWVAAATFTLAFLMWNLRYVFRRRRAMVLYTVLTVSFPIMLILAWAIYTFNPVIPGLIDQVLLTKISSESGVERMAWNTQAVQNFFDTWGLGTGIGAVRASGWLFSNIASLGLLGTVFMMWFVADSLGARPVREERGTGRAENAAALQAAACALLVQAMTTAPYPNLGASFFGVLGIAVGLLRYGVLLRPVTPYHRQSPTFATRRASPRPTT